VSVFISSSLYPNTSIDYAISESLSHFGKNIEISAPHNFEENYILKETLLKFKNKKVNFILHNYFPRPREDFVLNISTSNKNILKKVNEHIKNAIDLSHFVGSNIYGIHAGYLADSEANNEGTFVFKNNKNSYNVAIQNSISLLNKVSEYGNKKNVKILVENLFPFNNINNSLFSTFSQIKDFMKEAPKEIGILIDLGHLQISSKFYGFSVEKELDNILNLYSERIYEVHLSENDCINDLHKSLDKKSWQINALKKIKNCSTESGIERKYCLEVRNETTLNVSKSLQILNNL
tara:strand:- start:1369 stop:2244 length:876 start_codon:yes stop_codon:yes gene_type:complete